MNKQPNDKFAELEEHYAGYEVYDRDGEKIGKVDDLFVDENNDPEYLGVKMGFLGLKSTLIPWDMARVYEGEHRIKVSVDKDRVKEAPAFDDDEEITPEHEERVRKHYGVGSRQGADTRGAYGAYSGRGPTGEERLVAEERAGRGFAGEERPGVDMDDTDRERRGYLGERRRDRERERLGEERLGMSGASHRREEFREGLAPPGREGDPGRSSGGLQDEDELRMQRTEEELRAGTREREAGGVHVRKRVRTEREQVRVPKRREEVHVERVPVEGREASEAEIGEDEIFMPVTEEEVVVEKQPVIKEEIRLRKDVTQDEEIVEEDVRKEEIDVDDQSELRGGRRGGGRSTDDVVGDETRRRDR